jgi:hypothetical protein
MSHPRGETQSVIASTELSNFEPAKDLRHVAEAEIHPITPHEKKKKIY